jgi:hypothetical protein
MQPVTDQTDQKDGDELFQGPSLDASGRLEGRLNNVEPNLELNDVALRPAPAQEERLELEARHVAPVEERIENFRPNVPLPADQKRSGAMKFVLGALLLGLLALGGSLYFKPHLELPRDVPDGVHPSGFLDELTAGTDAPPIIISSTPTGATIIIGTKEVGQTPWAGENRWVGQTPVTLKLGGYKTWVGKLEGGEPQTLDITLKR